jgi:hypothetical protein
MVASRLQKYPGWAGLRGIKQDMTFRDIITFLAVTTRAAMASAAESILKGAAARPARCGLVKPKPSKYSPAVAEGVEFKIPPIPLTKGARGDFV